MKQSFEFEVVAEGWRHHKRDADPGTARGRPMSTPPKSRNLLTKAENRPASIRLARIMIGLMTLGAILPPLEPRVAGIFDSPLCWRQGLGLFS